MEGIPRTNFTVFFVCLFAGVLFSGCAEPRPQAENDRSRIPVAESFVYPVGKGVFVTQAKDSKDDWYNAQDLGENRHLGEDWNTNRGGNSDCGMPVKATAAGTVFFAGDADPGYSLDRGGSLDPSDFIDAHLAVKLRLESRRSLP